MHDAEQIDSPIVPDQRLRRIIEPNRLVVSEDTTNRFHEIPPAYSVAISLRAAPRAGSIVVIVEADVDAVIGGRRKVGVNVAPCGA